MTIHVDYTAHDKEFVEHDIGFINEHDCVTHMKHTARVCFLTPPADAWNVRIWSIQWVGHHIIQKALFTQSRYNCIKGEFMERIGAAFSARVQTKPLRVGK